MAGDGFEEALPCDRLEGAEAWLVDAWAGAIMEAWLVDAWTAAIVEAMVAWLQLTNGHVGDLVN